MGSGILKTCRRLSVFTLLGGGLFVIAFVLTTAPARAAAGINEEVNFQGRLLNAQGATVPDGFYNIEFSIYQDGDGQSAGDTTPAGSPGTLLWTEDYVDNNANAGVEVQNGFLSVQLGSICPFTGGSCEGHSNSAVNWNSNTLWLSMNVAGDNNACATFGGANCAADGEMLPMKRLSSSVYALNTNLLGGLSSAEFVQLGQGLQTDATTNASIAINKTGSGNLLDLQNNGADAFTLNGTGDVAFGANADHTLSVATAAASTAGSALTISGGAAGTGASALNGGNLTIAAGAGGGTNGNGGDFAIDAGAPNGSGAAGNITIGVNYATNITIGNTATGSQAKVQAGGASATVTNNGGLAAKGSGSTNATTAASVSNSSGQSLLSVGDDGTINAGVNPSNSYAFGYNTIGSNGQDSGFNGIITGQQFTPSSSTSVLSISVYVGGNVEASPYNQYQVGIYTDNAGAPGTDIASSSVGTLTPNAWNTMSVNASVTSGTAYWLVYTTNVQSGQGAANGLDYTSPASGNTHFYTPFTFGSGADNGMPASLSGATVTNNYAESIYASSTSGPAVTISSAGDVTGYGSATFKDTTSSTAAFQVQNASGDVVFTVDTSTNSTQGQVVLGKAGTNNGALVFQSSTAGGGAVTLQAPSIAAAASYALVLPTAAPSGSGQCLQTSSASQLAFGSCGTTGSFIFNQTSQQTGANFNIDGTGIAATELETATLDAATSSSALNIGLTSSGNANQINLNQNVQVTGDQTFATGANRKVSVAAASSGNGNNLTITAGDGASSGGNGGDLVLQGGMGTGTGTTGLVVLGTPTFSATTNDANCYTGGALVASTCTVAQSTVDNSSTVVVGFSVTEQTAFLPDPTNTTVGRVFYITAANGSKDFTLSVNGGGTGNEVAMRQNTSATMVWNGTSWAAAGASSSTTLQAAYDNTLQSAGGAELVVSHTSNTDGLTIRDSTVNPVNGTLVSVQNNSAATLLAVNNNVTEYSTDSGAEIAGSTSSTFPSGTWSAVGAASVSRYTTVGDFIATGQGSVSVGTTTAAEDGVEDTLSGALTANQHYNVSFAARLGSGTFTDMNVYYSVDGTTASVSCTDSHAVTTSIWTKVNCTFVAPSSGVTANNAILIRQTGSGTARSFYIDNLSVTIAADFNLATDGGVDDGTNFTTNWTSVSGATVTRSTTVGNDASDSAEVDTTGSGQGVRNLLAIDPLPSNLYRITVYAGGATAAFSDFTVSYSRDGGTSFVNCADYNTQTVSTSQTNFTEITCYINTDGTTATNPHVYFTQTDGTARTFYVDTFSMTLATATTPNVQIGGGVNGGPVTLLTLDRAASAPIASNNDAFLGSLYYDTTLGELQCYEADGWGSCGSSPNTVVTISPEYTNSVMHGTGVGTMTSDFCSDTLGINNGTGGQPTVCGTNETFNFYRWTSPQASAQTYSIYVTYQLPDTFKGFSSGQTNITGRTDSSNATVQYKVYRDSPSAGLIPCGSTVAVSSGSVSSWQTGVASGAADPSTCGFLASDSIVFEIDMTASQDADAYVSNLNFTFSHK